MWGGQIEIGEVNQELHRCERSEAELRVARKIDQSSLSGRLWREFASVLGARRQVTEKAVEHLPDFDHLTDEG